MRRLLLGFSLGMITTILIKFLFKRGTTSWEAQVGRVWARFLYPKLWCRRNWPFFRVTWVHKCPVSGYDCLDYQDCKNRNYCYLK